MGVLWWRGALLLSTESLYPFRRQTSANNWSDTTDKESLNGFAGFSAAINFFTSARMAVDEASPPPSVLTRTVAKYRESLSIPPSNQRKQLV
jgi:hypothetical protein